MRCFTEEDLEKAKAYFEKAGLPAQWVERPYQGRTLHVSDPLGAPLEFCATMTTKPRLVVAFEHHHGAVPQRIDHFQLLVPDVQRQLEFYMGLGFRLSEYIAPDGSDEPLFVFLQRKGNPHDIVFAPGAGPRLHHAAFSIPESYLFFYVCDLAFNMGFAENIEFGPGRHGPGHALFVYMRDPDGHRIELFNTHYQCIDIEDEPVRWDASVRRPAALAIAGARAVVRRGEPLRRRRAARAGEEGQSDDAGEICCERSSAAHTFAMQPVLDPQQDRIGDRREGEQHDRDRHHVLGSAASDIVVHDHEAEALLRGEHFAEQHAEQRHGEADAQSGKHFRQGRRQQHRPDRLPRRQLQCARRAQINRRDGADRRPW